MPVSRPLQRHRIHLLLILLAGLSLSGYFALRLWFPLSPFFDRFPLPDVRTLAPTLGEAAAYALLLGALYLLYLLAYSLVQRLDSGLSIVLILFTAALFCLPLLSTFPINATDVYRYFIRGRISSVHGQNPFLVPVAELEEESFALLAGEWANETSPYGPIWELTAGTTTQVTSDNLAVGLVTFKGIAALAFLACGLLIWLAMNDVAPAKRSALTLLWAWNPALLLTFAMDGHNDSLMLLWLLLGWWLMIRGQTLIGLIVMLLAPLTKPIGLLPLPYFFLAGWRLLPGRRARLRYLFLTGISALVLLWLAFLPFGSPLDLVQRLLGEATSGGGFTPLALFILEAREAGFDPPVSTSIRLFTGVFLIFGIWLAWLTWRGRSPLRAAADIFAGYILQAFRFRIWYTAWPFPWLVLDRGRSADADGASKGRLAAGLTILLTSQLSVLIYGQIRTELLGNSHLRAHRAGIAFTFLLPLLVGVVVAAYSARSDDRQKEK